MQNASSMISLLTDFYELSGDQKYLDYANDMAQWLMKLQSKTDGSYRSHKTHYTCVIYPAKSMLELSVAERNAGFTERSRKHFQSAKSAILNLSELMDNIETEGEMTFEDVTKSQRIEEFSIIANGKTVYSGTAVGLKKICILKKPVKNCSQLIIRIDKCRLQPHIGNINVY